MTIEERLNIIKKSNLDNEDKILMATGFLCALNGAEYDNGRVMVDSYINELKEQRQ